jgi:hypothetical protein
VDWSKIFKKGMCPEVEGMKDLEPAKMSGDWYIQMTSDYSKQMLPTTCSHVKVDVNEDGTFTAIDENRYIGKDWVAQNLSGEISGDSARIEFFDNNFSKKMQVVDTDYDTYAIWMECFDDQLFALEKEVEPVHMLKIHVVTRDPVVDDEVVLKTVSTAVEKIEGVTEDDFKPIEQDETCVYRGFEVNEQH